MSCLLKLVSLFVFLVTQLLREHCIGIIMLPSDYDGEIRVPYPPYNPLYCIFLTNFIISIVSFSLFSNWISKKCIERSFVQEIVEVHISYLSLSLIFLFQTNLNMYVCGLSSLCLICFHYLLEKSHRGA